MTETETKPTYYFGVDLAYSSDYTGLAIVQRKRIEKKTSYRLVHLERVPQQTSYPNIAATVADKMNDERLKGMATLIVDATGPGLPVLQSFREHRLRPYGILIHGGDQVTRDEKDDHIYRVPKRDLVSVLLLFYQNRRFELTKSLKHAELLVDELENFHAKITVTGHDTYGAGRSSKHDDLVLAAAMAVWAGENIRPIYSVFAHGIAKGGWSRGSTKKKSSRRGDSVIVYSNRR